MEGDLCYFLPRPRCKGSLCCIKESGRGAWAGGVLESQINTADKNTLEKEKRKKEREGRASALAWTSRNTHWPRRGGITSRVNERRRMRRKEYQAPASDRLQHAGFDHMAPPGAWNTKPCDYPKHTPTRAISFLGFSGSFRCQIYNIPLPPPFWARLAPIMTFHLLVCPLLSKKTLICPACPSQRTKQDGARKQFLWFSGSSRSP